MNMKKITLLLLGIINVIGIGLVSPVMNQFAADFPQVSSMAVAMVVTMPAITLLVGLAICAAITNKVQRKLILLSGIGCTVLGGIAPAFLHDFNLILVSRGLLGLGMGLGMPLQTTFFAEYPEEERAVLFGLNTGIGSIASAGLLFVIALAELPWRSAFLLYGFFAVVFVFSFLFIPFDPKRTDADAVKTEVAETTQKLPLGQILFYYIAIFFVYVQYFIVPTTISFYLEQNGMATAQAAGLISGFGTLAMAAGSIAFPWLRNLFEKWFMPLLFAVGAICFILYAFPVNIVFLTVIYCVLAMFSALLPISITMKLTEVLPFRFVAIGSALFTAAIYLGQFSSPYYQAMAVQLLTHSIEKAYILFGVVVFVLGCIDVVLVLRERNEEFV